MIYRQSNDPVFLKKINIDVWLLRDQLEQIILSRLEADPNIKNFDDLIEEFAPKSKPNLRLLKFEDEPDSETNTNKKEASPDKQSEEGNQDEEKQNEKSKQEIKSATPSEEINNKKEVITQRLPNLPKDKINQGKTFLSEVHMDRMLFFSNKQFIEGQSIVIQFNIPQRFILNAEVLYSQSYSLKNRIISDSNMPFRICVQFTFLKSGERTLLRKFLEDIEFRGFDENLSSTDKEDGEDEQANEEKPIADDSSSESDSQNDPLLEQEENTDIQSTSDEDKADGTNG